MSENGYVDWLWRHREELGLSLAFSLLSAVMVLMAGGDQVTKRKAFLVISAAFLVDAAATSFAMGAMNWPMFVAIPVGAVSGLVGLPVMMTVIRAGKRVEARADDIADKGINMIPGAKGGDK